MLFIEYMKKRIVNKKLKKDCLVNLWIKQLNHSYDMMLNHMLKISNNSYKDKNSLWYCQFKIGNWMLNYELMQAIKIGSRKYNIKEKQVYTYIFPHKTIINWKQYKNLLINE